MCYNHRYKGEFTTSLQEMLASGAKTPYQFVNAKTSVLLDTSLQLLEIRKEIKHTFMDFMRGGLEIGLFVGIDFTGSNGNPSSPTSLHYIDQRNPHNLNQY